MIKNFIKDFYREPIVKLILVLFTLIILRSISIHLLSYYKYYKLDLPLSRQREAIINRQKLAEIMQRDFYKLQIYYINMIMSKHLNTINYYYKKITRQIEILKTILDVLKNGGVYENVEDLNLPEIDKFKETIYIVKNNIDGYSLEYINIAPKINDLACIIDD